MSGGTSPSVVRRLAYGAECAGVEPGLYDRGRIKCSEDGDRLVLAIVRLRSELQTRKTGRQWCDVDSPIQIS